MMNFASQLSQERALISELEIFEINQKIEPMSRPWILYLLLFLAPLPFASARPLWQWMWVSYIGIGVLCFLVLPLRKKLLAKTEPPKLSILVAATVAIYGFVQSLIPVDLQEEVGSGNVGFLFEDQPSINSAQTINTASFFLAHLSLFCLVFSICNRRIQALRTLRICGLVVVIYSIYGLIVFKLGNDKVLWLPKSSSFHSLTSTFVNRNNFATFAGLGLQCLIAYASFWWRNELENGAHTHSTNKRALVGSLTKAWWLPITITLVASALFLTNSRAGIISAVLAVFLLVILSAEIHQKKRFNLTRKLTSSAIALIFFTSVFSLSGKLLESRLQFDLMANQRIAATPIYIDIINTQPLKGYGLGVFKDIFRVFRDETITIYFDRAHNDYLELAITAGIPATLALMLAITSLVIFSARSLALDNRFKGLIALGISATFQISLHSIVDFPMQIPAISYLWVTILAASVALANQCRAAANKK